MTSITHVDVTVSPSESKLVAEHPYFLPSPSFKSETRILSFDFRVSLLLIVHEVSSRKVKQLSFNGLALACKMLSGTLKSFMEKIFTPAVKEIAEHSTSNKLEMPLNCRTVIPEIKLISTQIDFSLKYDFA